MTDALYRSRLADQPIPFHVDREERLADGFRALDRLHLRHDRFDGEAVEVKREILRGGTCVVIIPYDPREDRIVLVRQFRIGAALASENAAPLELPAGLLDEGEAPADAAARELLEETGLRALALQHAWSILSSPGLTDETAMVFLAIVDASDLAATGGKADEDILLVPAPVDALVEAVDGGRILNGFLVAATHWFARLGRAKAKVLADSLFEDR